jgi:hypothetical protein
MPATLELAQHFHQLGRRRDRKQSLWLGGRDYRKTLAVIRPGRGDPRMTLIGQLDHQ